MMRLDKQTAAARTLSRRGPPYFNGDDGIREQGRQKFFSDLPSDKKSQENAQAVENQIADIGRPPEKGQLPPFIPERRA
jgi:hypothetical protein